MDYIKNFDENGTRITMKDIIEDIDGLNTTDTLDRLFLMNNLGTKSDTIGNQFYGINHRQTASLVAHNTDQNGYVFFTRPALNLSTANIAAIRKLHPLLNTEDKSLGRIIRCYLDPKLGRMQNPLRCPFVDPMNVFMPLLSNNLITMSPPPSTTLGTYTTGTPGVYKEVWSMAADQILDYSAYNISCSFRNLQGNPFLLLFYSWMLYTSLQFLDDGPIPYPEDMIEYRMNYNTRMYRLVMDHSKTYVQHIWAPTYAFPIGIESGSIFGYDLRGSSIKSEMRELEIQFQCVGNHFNDHLLVDQFNTSVGLLNGLMIDANRNKYMVKVSRSALQIFNYMGYPRINPDTYELEWYVTAEQYNARKHLIATNERLNYMKLKGNAHGAR